MAEYRRRRRAHRRSRAVPAAAVAGGIAALVAVLVQLLPLVAAAVLVAGVGMLHRLLRTPADVHAWRRGALGEPRTAMLLRSLERRGYVLLHDLAIPASRANLDHLLVGPTGVWLLDSKNWRGHVGVDETGLLWHGHQPAADTLRTLWWEVAQVDLALAAAGFTLGARPVLAVTGAWLAAPLVDARGVTVTHPALLAEIVHTAPIVLPQQNVPVVAAALRERFPPEAA